MNKEKIINDALAMLKEGFPLSVVAKKLGVSIADILILDDEKALAK
jgi:hypothetical protein